ncbi:MAG: hypothetical protein PHW13_02785 [Methylococcales bacterium]|nr:hypothetical protein [Methylococcales bacterium]
MAITQDDQDFISEMIRELDESIRRLVAEEQRLSARLGAERVSELWEFWQKELPSADEERFKLAMDHEDKKLTWIWLRLKRIHQSRAKAGQALMKNNTQ